VKEFEWKLPKELRWKHYKHYKKRELFSLLRTEIRRLRAVNEKHKEL